MTTPSAFRVNMSHPLQQSTVETGALCALPHLSEAGGRFGVLHAPATGN